MKKGRKFLVCMLLIVLLCSLGCGIYIHDYYHADETATAAMVSDECISVQTADGITVFSPALPEAGFIFYPGGKVEYSAYAPLMLALARENILCVLVEMPGNLAVLDVNAAEDIPGMFPEIDRWYIGGHSLGGSMAASFAAKYHRDYEGLILLAAYSTADLTDTDLNVLLLRCDRDGVLNMEKYDKYLPNLPESTLELVIPGGNHAQFGSYGQQEGDGTATISAEEQITQTVQAILELINT